MTKQHTIFYVPGLGDRNLSGRRTLLSLWKFRNVSIEICSMDWTINEPWRTKLSRLIKEIDAQTDEGRLVSLIGESAGATAVIEALQQRPTKLHKVILLCGKSQYPDRVAPARYSANPAFKDALIASSSTIPNLSLEQKSQLINLHPIWDPVVPVPETKIAGVVDRYMPIIGHATGIVFANTIWSWRIVQFLKKAS